MLIIILLCTYDVFRCNNNDDDEYMMQEMHQKINNTMSKKTLMSRIEIQNSFLGTEVCSRSAFQGFPGWCDDQEETVFCRRVGHTTYRLNKPS
jgi:hypothetical protein